MGYIRKKTRPQGDRAIKHEQSNFGEGLNLDLPATDINTNANPNLENYIAYERYADGRTGSVEVFTPSIGSGTIHSIEIHPENNICVMHRGVGLFTLSDFSGEIVGLTTSLGFTHDVDSKLVVYGDDFLLTTPDDGIFRLVVNIPTVPKFLEFNGPQPLDIGVVTSGTNTGEFKYKYIYTFSTILQSDGEQSTLNRLAVGNKVFMETPPIRPIGSASSSQYFFQHNRNAATESGNTTELDVGAGESFPDNITHVSWYRTPDLGQNGLDNLAFDQYAWISDEALLLTFGVLTDGTSDDTVNYRLTHAPNLRLKNIGWQALPNGLLAETTPGFLFTAQRNGKKVSYSQRIPDDTRVGYHDAGVQFQEFDDGVNILAKLPDALAVIENQKSSIMNLTSTIDSGVNQTVISIDNVSSVDDDIGVIDAGSFTKAEDGSYISICSDKSIRVFDATGWSRDLSLDRIGRIIDRINTGASIAKYYNGAYYLWFTLDDSETNPDDCLRLSIKRSSGKGWTFISGEDWVFPSSVTGLMVGNNSFIPGESQKQDYFFVLNEANGIIYWIETFDGLESATINGFPVLKYYADRISSSSPNGTNIPCIIRTREVTGSQESFNIKHSESHIYIRDTVNQALPSNIPAPPSGPVTYPELFLDAAAYVDGVQIPVETVSGVSPGEDIQFWRKVEGSRIAIEFISNRSGHRITKIDGRFRVQDINRPNSGPLQTETSSYQEDFKTNFVHWLFTRPLPMLDMINRTKFPLLKTPLQTGPDLRSNAVEVGVVIGQKNPFIIPSRSAYDNGLAISFWVGNLVYEPASLPLTILSLLDSSGTIEISITSSESTKIGITGDVEITVDDLNSGGTNGFHHIVFNATLASGVGVGNWYQNGVLKGTSNFNFVGGGGIELGEVAI